MITLLVSCSDQHLMDNVADISSTVEKSEGKAKIDTLVEKARWGDGQAFLQLADCYRDGIGVNKDFLGVMCMAEQAAHIGSINNEEDYFSLLPNDNVYKQCFDIMNMRSSKLRESKDSILAKLEMLDSPDAQALYGALNVEFGDTIGGFETIREAAENGSDFAVILLTMQNGNGDLRPDKNKLKKIADRNPVVYKLLGKIYHDFEEDNDINKRQAALYYLEAEKYALLTKREAMWLLSYYKNGGDIYLSSEDVKRLKAFSNIHDD